MRRGHRLALWVNRTDSRCFERNLCSEPGEPTPPLAPNTPHLICRCGARCHGNASAAVTRPARNLGGDPKQNLVTMETGVVWREAASRLVSTGSGWTLARWFQVFLPEHGQAQRPEDQRQPQVQFGPRLHEVLTSEHQGGVQRAEHERLAPAGQKENH